MANLLPPHVKIAVSNGSCYAGRMCSESAVSPPPSLPHDVYDRLRAYAGLLATWTRRINLVSAADRGAIWPRHVEDCLRLRASMPPGAERGIDLGSGAGLPGLVLAIATGVWFDLIEADQRKAAFLREAARLTGAPVRVHAVRIEHADVAPAPLVTARALAPLPRLLGLAAPLLAAGGTMLAPKGARSAEELRAARAGWSFGADAAGTPDSPVLVITNPVRIETAVHA